MKFRLLVKTVFQHKPVLRAALCETRVGVVQTVSSICWSRLAGVLHRIDHRFVHLLVQTRRVQCHRRMNLGHSTDEEIACWVLGTMENGFGNELGRIKRLWQLRLILEVIFCVLGKGV